VTVILSCPRALIGYAGGAAESEVYVFNVHVHVLSEFWTPFLNHGAVEPAGGHVGTLNKKYSNKRTADPPGFPG
jgi:hypothetical protein